VPFDARKWAELGWVFTETAALILIRGEVFGRYAFVGNLKGMPDDFHGVLSTSNELITVDENKTQTTSDFLEWTREIFLRLIVTLT
jgi:hypothetical protein